MQSDKLLTFFNENIEMMQSLGIFHEQTPQAKMLFKFNENFEKKFQRLQSRFEEIENKLTRLENGR